MRLIHVTDKKNLPSIKKNGLDPNEATGKRAAVWAVAPSKAAWAVLHTLEKKRAKGRSAADHVVLEIEVPRTWLRRAWKGIWYSHEPIPFSRVVAVRPASEYAESYPA